MLASVNGSKGLCIKMRHESAQNALLNTVRAYNVRIEVVPPSGTGIKGRSATVSELHTRRCNLA